MNEDILKNHDYVEELVKLIRSGLGSEELIDQLSDYHDNDIAGALERLNPEERKKIFEMMGPDRVAEILPYFEEPDEYLQEMGLRQAAEVISEMDSDDAVDILEELDDSTQNKLVEMMDDESSRDVQLILSYSDDEIGSKMTTNFVLIHENLGVREAMKELVRQAGENDNISTIYVADSADRYCGAIDLKDLIIARQGTSLDDIISTSYPYVTDHEKIADCIEDIKDYAEDSIPVLNDQGHVIGVITSQDIVEVVDEEMGEDYAKLAGLTAEAELEESTRDGMKKRLPWLIALMFLGLVVSSVVGEFEVVVTLIPIVASFQSMILDMAGNIGTQSLAVTIRMLMDESLTGREKLRLVAREMKLGLVNGLVLGVMAFVFIGLYIRFVKGYDPGYSFTIAGCVGISLTVAMIISSGVGTLVPMFFHKIHIDPAVASGPLITTVNDLVAVVTYYGLVWIFLVDVMHMH